MEAPFIRNYLTFFRLVTGEFTTLFVLEMKYLFLLASICFVINQTRTLIDFINYIRVYEYLKHAEIKISRSSPILKLIF